MADIVHNYCCDVFNRMEQEHNIRMDERQPLNPERGDQEAPRQGCCVKYKWMIRSSQGTLLVIVLSLNLSLSVYAIVSQTQEKQATYIRFGASHCHGVEGTSMVYHGITVGINTTGQTNFHCLPTDGSEANQYYEKSKHGSTPVLLGIPAIYETFKEQSDHRKSVCALCRVEGRDTIEVLPVYKECQGQSWTLEYQGYLMAAGTCVDKDMEVDPASKTESGPILSHIVVNSIDTNYVENKVLSCVVCSK